MISRATIRDVKKPGQPGLPAAEAARVLESLAHLRDSRFGGNATALARALGLSQSAMSQLFSRKNRPSYATAAALANYLKSDTAVVLAGLPDDAPESAVHDHYPARALALARLRGLLPPPVVRSIRAVEVHDDRPLDETEWIELALTHLRRHEQIQEIEARLVLPTGRTK